VNKKQEFTPGPWELEISDPNIFIRQKGVSAFPIAYVGRMHHEKEADANANLITTAVNACFAINKGNPLSAAEALMDMYKALKDLLDTFNRCEAGFPPEYEMRILVKEMAEIALAKVEGSVTTP